MVINKLLYFRVDKPRFLFRFVGGRRENKKSWETLFRTMMDNVHITITIISSTRSFLKRIRSETYWIPRLCAVL